MADKKMIKTAGEHWVCATLARHNWAPALTRDGIERTDILAVGTHLRGRPRIEIQVKTEYDRGSKMLLLGKQVPPTTESEYEWFVFVVLPSDPKAPPEAFVMPRNHIAAAAWIHHHYCKVYKQHKTKLVKIFKWYLLGYKGCWDLLDCPANDVPIRLPNHLREWGELDGVGLPPDHPWGHELREEWNFPYQGAPEGWREVMHS